MNAAEHCRAGNDTTGDSEVSQPRRRSAAPLGTWSAVNLEPVDEANEYRD